MLISKKGHPSTQGAYRGQQSKPEINQEKQEEKRMIGFAKKTTNPIKF